MNLRFYPIDLQLKHTFTISRGSRDVVPVVMTEIEHEGIIGYGEASPSTRYNETSESVMAFLGKVDLAQFEDPMNLDKILRYIESVELGNSSAKASIDIALHDWIGKKMNLPLWKWWGLDKEKAPVTSFTIGIDTLAGIEQKVNEAAYFPILKIKLGGPNDEEIVKRIRELTGKILRVDANEGWKTKEEACDKILWLERHGVECVEQPLPASDLEGTSWLREQVSIPIIADESVVNSSDINKLQYVFDGINIKLMKCGGLREAMRMIFAAKILGMKIMMGCMIESSVAISAAAQLSPLIDYADLDGNVLTSNDPFLGMRVNDGKIILDDHPGIGVVKAF